jgi:filamentous hemagglutinin family protein
MRRRAGFIRIDSLVLARTMMILAIMAESGARANPTGGTVSQGTATFNNSGSHLTVTTSDRAFINWQTFNIVPGETTSFVQPSSSSVVWNQINDPNPSEILGNLNANGYVILQNQSGFFVGGQASIKANGLVMTTARTPMPDLASGGPWAFNAPPPAAKIINYGQLSVNKGGSLFLIGSDIENHGTISAPEGNIGLYAGKQVLVSERPDGLGLSANVTLPAGSVDNTGKLIADAGTIAVHAEVVNQGGLVQANSIREVNGTIELVASDAINLGQNSVVSARGDSAGQSAGGLVTIHSNGAYTDQPTSVIDVSGGQSGGNGGNIEISANEMSSIQSAIRGQAGAGFTSGKLLIDPQNIVLTAGGDNAPPSGTVNPGDPPSAGSPDTLTLNVNSFNNLITQNQLSQINLQATQDIEINTMWTIPASTVPGASVTLQAGRNITIDNDPNNFNGPSGIQAGRNWSLTLSAGSALAAGSIPTAGNYGVYLNGGSILQTQNGNITVSAANEVIINADAASAGNNGIRTMAGGSIDVTTQYGDVNTGGNPVGFSYNNTAAPWYKPGVLPALGGISTAAGGDVTINAGGNVYSFAPTAGMANSIIIADGGTGAFGPQPGNVTINAGDSVFGHYILANGIGSITAGGDIGADTGNPFALSLIKGTWNIDAPNGNIYLQEVRNPNGDFNTAGKTSSASHHLFDYDPQSAVDLTAGIGVYLTGSNLPRGGDAVPVIYPPTLDITAGSGGVVLENSVILFPSAYGNLNITTTGGGNLETLTSGAIATPPELLMSDSSAKQWQDSTTFTDSDHGPTLAELNNPNPVVINVSGNMENLTLITSKETKINVGGDMINCGFSGQNLHPGDITSITVGGSIINASAYNFIFLPDPIPLIPAADLPPKAVNSWDEIFNLALNPDLIGNVNVPANLLLTPDQLAGYAFQNAPWFTSSANSIAANPGFVYNAQTGRLGFPGQMSQTIVNDLEKPLVVLRYGPDGFPEVSNGKFVTDVIQWAPVAAIQTLFSDSIGTPSPASGQLGYRIGGPGQFDITADSISLGNTYGILSCGVADPQGGFDRYGNLAPVTQTGATINLRVEGDLTMETSTIAAIGGGNVNLTSVAGSMDLGSQELFNTQRQIGFGVFTSGIGDVSVVAAGDVNVDGSRIAAFNGGSVNVESLHGNVNAGSGGATITGAGVSYVDPVTGLAGFYAEDVFGSGILAYTLVDSGSVPGAAARPGNITVKTPEGSISASQGGILQEALNGNVDAGPTVTLQAGTPATADSPGFAGNIDLGNSGVIGGTVNVTANGNITGLIVSRQDSSINAAANFSGTALSGGTVGLTAGGTASGVVIGVQGVSASSGTPGGNLTALGQNVSVNGGAAVSTLGTTATATAASQSAANQANSESQQQVAASTSSQDDDMLNKKRKGPPLTIRVGRVTVILPKS